MTGRSIRYCTSCHAQVDEECGKETCSNSMTSHFVYIPIAQQLRAKLECEFRDLKICSALYMVLLVVIVHRTLRIMFVDFLIWFILLWSRRLMQSQSYTHVMSGQFVS